MRDEWKKVTLGEIADLQTGPFGSQLKSEEYVQNGIPVVMPINIDLSGTISINKIAHTSEKKASLLKKYKLKNGDIVFSRRGDLSKIGYITNDQSGWLCGTGCLRARPKENILSCFLHLYLKQKNVANWLEDNSIGQTMKNINTDILSKLPIILPSYEEQKKIAESLSIWDSAIEKTEKLIEKKEALLNWYAKRILISGKTSKVLFSDLFKLSSEKNTLNQSYPALSVTKDGVVFQEEYFNKRVASEDTSNYLIARRNTFVFSGLNFWMGSVDLQTLTDIGIISPAYKVFTINTDLISYEYAHFLIRSNYMKRLLMDSSIVGASIVRRNLDMDNLLNSAIELPTLEQQSKIVEQLSIIQKDIELNKMLLNQYKLQKQGLMQKLLTGEWRVK